MLIAAKMVLGGVALVLMAVVVALVVFMVREFVTYE